jgi:DNA-binding Lrp family transcriptional regulator
MVDEIDRIILSQLGKNSRISSKEIAMTLKNLNHHITDRAVRQRLHRLEKNNTILGYTTVLNPKLISEKINRTVLLKFKSSKNTPKLIERLIDYTDRSDFCIFSSRLNGDVNWVGHFVFDSISQYDLETNNFLNKFSELISDYSSHESNLMKLHNYTTYDDELIKKKKIQVSDILNSIKKHDTLNDRLQAIVESLVKYFDAQFARIWFVDEKEEFLKLKFSAGKYTRINGEFSKVPFKSLKIGKIATSKKPVVSNDISNDTRVKYPDWAKKEQLKSFAGYPLMHKDRVMAVLALFSSKSFSPSDFEILGIFSEQISKELVGFFETKDFLLE